MSPNNSRSISEELLDLQLTCKEHALEYDWDDYCPACERCAQEEQRELEYYYASTRGVEGMTI